MNQRGHMVTDYGKAATNLTREYVNTFLEGLGLNPREIASFEVHATRLIVTRFIYNDDGTHVLDHLGPRTVETHFSIRDANKYRPGYFRAND